MRNKQYLTKEYIIANLFPGTEVVTLKLSENANTAYGKKINKLKVNLVELKFNVDYSKCLFTFVSIKDKIKLELDFKYYNKFWWIYVK